MLLKYTYLCTCAGADIVPGRGIMSVKLTNTKELCLWRDFNHNSIVDLSSAVAFAGNIRQEYVGITSGWLENLAAHAQL